MRYGYETRSKGEEGNAYSSMTLSSIYCHFLIAEIITIVPQSTIVIWMPCYFNSNRKEKVPSFSHMKLIQNYETNHQSSQQMDTTILCVCVCVCKYIHTFGAWFLVTWAIWKITVDFRYFVKCMIVYVLLIVTAL